MIAKAPNVLYALVLTKNVQS